MTIDTDGSGTISVHELGVAMRSLGEQLSDDDIRAMVREADADCELPLIAEREREREIDNERNRENDRDR